MFPMIQPSMCAYFHASFTLAWMSSNTTNRRRPSAAQMSHTVLHFSFAIVQLTLNSSPFSSQLGELTFENVLVLWSYLA